MSNSIILSTSEVRAILSGDRCFRRVMKYQITNDEGEIVNDVVAGQFNPTVIDKYGDEQPGDEVWGAISDDAEWAIKSPYQPGQVIYCREAWEYDLLGLDYPDYEPCYFLKQQCEGVNVLASGQSWKSPATMPRSAARLFLRIESVSVERIGEVWYWNFGFELLSTTKPEGI